MLVAKPPVARKASWTLHARIDPKLKQQVLQLAAFDHRSLQGQITYMIERYIYARAKGILK